MFTDRGYIAYKGYFSLEEIMDGSQSSNMEIQTTRHGWVHYSGTATEN